MKNKGQLTNVTLTVLGTIFILSLVLIVFINNKTQTENFWDNQQEQLSLITEKCATEINDWAILHTTILNGFAEEIASNRLRTISDYEDYLTIVAKQNPEILLAYIMFDDGTLHMNGATTIIDLTGKEFEEWYWAGRNGGGEVIFSEPCIDEVTGSLVVSCVKSITMPDGKVGIAGIDIELEDLNARINNLNPSKNGGAWTASPRGRVMTYIDPELLPKIVDGKTVYVTADEVISQTTVIDVNDKFSDKGIEISYIVDYDNVIKYEATTTIPQTGWILGVNIPIHDYDDAVQSVIRDQLPIILLAILMSIISVVFAFVLITNARRQQNLQKHIEIAQAASKTKSDFLSRMSHEIRTPMNAIIGMARIADNTSDTGKLRYCLSTIESSSTHLLGIINDILDMSKIEAGKLELYDAPMNVEKMLMKICNLIIDRTEQKNQKLEIVLGSGMGMNYMGDDLRLSQVITNLLSNAVKFTPEGGRIKLMADEINRTGDDSILRFTISDTGIGMTKDQIDRLFNSFEQADNSISRRFGGTGLGLAIAKNIIEKMGGNIRVQSTPGKGTTFEFDVKVRRMPKQEGGIIFGGISPSDLKILVVDNDEEIRAHFKSITEQFGIFTDEADSGNKAIYLADVAMETQKPYDVIFIDYDMPDMDGIETARNLSAKIDKNTVIIITSFLTWNKIEEKAAGVGVSRFIAKPLFPSSIMDVINEVVGRTAKNLDVKSSRTREVPDFSGVNLLIAEDVEINREIFMALLEETNINIDTAENGLQAVQKFESDQDKYDIIVMDVQMPEMDGYEATRTIRAINTEKARSIPIIAMTANAFKEDIDDCLACGMNDHIAKPIDEKVVVEKIGMYLRGKKGGFC